MVGGPATCSDRDPAQPPSLHVQGFCSDCQLACVPLHWLTWAQTSISPLAVLLFLVDLISTRPFSKQAPYIGPDYMLTRAQRASTFDSLALNSIASLSLEPRWRGSSVDRPSRACYAPSTALELTLRALRD